MPKSQPSTYRAEEAGRTPRRSHIYIVQHNDELVHLTGHDKPVVVTGLPTTKGSDPQTFTPCQIGHTTPEQSSEIGASNVTVTLAMADSVFADRLRELLLYNPARTVVVTVARAVSQLLPGPIEWGTDTYVTFKGVGDFIDFGDEHVSVALLSLLLQADGQVPRYYDQKTCQHAFTGTLCGVDPDAANVSFETTLDAAALRGRYVDVSETQLDGEDMTNLMMQGGVLFELDGPGGDVLNTVTISRAEALPASAGTRLYLGWWTRTLAAGANVKVMRGCDRSLTTCTDDFANQANYGGMPWIPDASPSVHGRGGLT